MPQLGSSRASWWGCSGAKFAPQHPGQSRPDSVASLRRHPQQRPRRSCCWLFACCFSRPAMRMPVATPSPAGFEADEVAAVMAPPPVNVMLALEVEGNAAEETAPPVAVASDNTAMALLKGLGFAEVGFAAPQLLLTWQQPLLLKWERHGLIHHQAQRPDLPLLSLALAPSSKALVLLPVSGQLSTVQVNKPPLLLEWRPSLPPLEAVVQVGPSPLLLGTPPQWRALRLMRLLGAQVASRALHTSCPMPLILLPPKRRSLVAFNNSPGLCLVAHSHEIPKAADITADPPLMGANASTATLASASVAAPSLQLLQGGTDAIPSPPISGPRDRSSSGSSSEVDSVTTSNSSSSVSTPVEQETSVIPSRRSSGTDDENQLPAFTPLPLNGSWASNASDDERRNGPMAERRLPASPRRLVTVQQASSPPGPVISGTPMAAAVTDATLIVVPAQDCAAEPDYGMLSDGEYGGPPRRQQQGQGQRSAAVVAAGPINTGGQHQGRHRGRNDCQPAARFEAPKPASWGERRPNNHNNSWSGPGIGSDRRMPAGALPRGGGGGRFQAAPSEQHEQQQQQWGAPRSGPAWWGEDASSRIEAAPPGFNKGHTQQAPAGRALTNRAPLVLSGPAAVPAEGAPAQCNGRRRQPKQQVVGPVEAPPGKGWVRNSGDNGPMATEKQRARRGRLDASAFLSAYRGLPKS